jgi:3-hydroxyacyl-CoA dehydrogenase
MARIAIIGTGVIGSSWAALFAARGNAVAATDPRPDTVDELRRAVERCWPSLERQGLVVEDGSPDLVTVAESATAAARDATFVQESAPERLDLKHELYRELDAVTDAEVVIASSSSGLMASDIQQACERHPERVVIGHPFNPPHLVPLVEVVGGEATSDAAVATAIDVYASIGKSPIHIRAELPGHVTNRLQAALWREAYWLVEQGVVSVADVDRAISSGPGLRWALLGPFATQHLSGGDAGIAHVLDHLGPPMVEWWETLRTATWTPELKAAVVAGVDAELAGIDQDRMLDERDRLLEQLVVAKATAHDLPGGNP